MVGPWSLISESKNSMPKMLLYQVVVLATLVVSNSLQSHELQHTRFPCPSLSPRVCSNSLSLSQWCHSNMSSSVIPFSCCPQSFPASRYFPMSWLFAPGGQSIGASASVLPVNIQGWFSFRLTGSLSLLSKGLSRIISSTTARKH